jgi:hypothetical protein
MIWGADVIGAETCRCTPSSDHAGVRRAEIPTGLAPVVTSRGLKAAEEFAIPPAHIDAASDNAATKLRNVIDDLAVEA